jgi:hypothetical protein
MYFGQIHPINLSFPLYRIFSSKNPSLQRVTARVVPIKIQQLLADVFAKGLFV